MTVINSGTSAEKICITWPAQAKVAFDYAMSIWSDVLENTQNIGVKACWSNDFAPNVGGSAGPAKFYS